MTPFMTATAQVADGRAADLGAVVHIDGSARVQTVTAAGSPDFCVLLDEIDARLGAPIALNTSLNGNGEPIVASEADAVGFFMSHPVDAMLLEDILFIRR